MSNEVLCLHLLFVLFIFLIPYIFLFQLKVVAIADPREYVRRLFAQKYGVPQEMQFSDWRDVANQQKLADFVLICTPDKLHKDPAIAFANKDYHILLEKPMAVSAQKISCTIEVSEAISYIFLSFLVIVVHSYIFIKQSQSLP